MAIVRRLAITPAIPKEPPAPKLITRGNPNAKIIVVCEPPTAASWNKGSPMDFDSLQHVAQFAMKYGLQRDDIEFVSLCPPIPESIMESASKKKAHIAPNLPALMAHIEKRDPLCVVALGADAASAVAGRVVAITKSRGKAKAHLIAGKERVFLPMLSPAYTRRMPDQLPMFDSDWLVLAKLKMGDWVLPKEDHLYVWREDISDILRDPPRLISLDTETTGLRWWKDDVRVLTVQMSWEEGQAICMPVNRAYWPEVTPRQLSRLKGQIREIAANPRVRKVGHNIKFDDSMMGKEGMPVAGWLGDTQLMAFSVDENMPKYGLDDCVRRWVPPMAGYSDAFEEKGYLSHMIDCPREDMLEYGGADVDADLRLFKTLDRALESDPRQRNCYERIMMPGIMAFSRHIEKNGILIDQEHLADFGQKLDIFIDDTYRNLIAQVPAAVRLKHAEKGLSFTRDQFVHDILFTPEGFNLQPVVFTPGTRKAENKADRVASTSTKDHLPYFTDAEEPIGQFVTDLMDYQKTVKMRGTYVGSPEDHSGFWQYMASNGRIYPSYMLHRTVTGRTASNDPNGQNFPKRGRLAKDFLKIFKATPGFKIVSADLSQIELRIAAWMAMDRAMLQIYRDNGDIHTATAKYVSGLTDSQWALLTKEEKKLKRTQAKAVNFGFLYGMGWSKFMSYAKTDYQVTYNEREAKVARERFFTLYNGLPAWHDRMREFADENGFVRALHGAVRHLPNIRSNDKMVRSGAQRQAINSPVQRFGSDLGLMAVIRFAMQADPELFRVIGFVHDAVLVEAREGYEQECMSALVWAMENQPLEDWFGIRAPLPIKAEADIGINFGQTLEMGDLPPVEQRPKWFTDMQFEAFAPAKPGWWDDNKEEEGLSQFRIVNSLSDVGL